MSSLRDWIAGKVLRFIAARTPAPAPLRPQPRIRCHDCHQLFTPTAGAQSRCKRCRRRRREGAAKAEQATSGNRDDREAAAWAASDAATHRAQGMAAQNR